MKTRQSYLLVIVSYAAIALTLDADLKKKKCKKNVVEPAFYVHLVFLAPDIFYDQRFSYFSMITPFCNFLVSINL